MTAMATDFTAKTTPAGGKGGYPFDSGANLSGVTRICVDCGDFNYENVQYLSTIKRVYLDFKNPISERDAPFLGFDVDTGKSNTHTLDLLSGDTIVKAVVWADHNLANAVQFHLASGQITPMFGIPSHGARATSFHGEKGSQLVGMYGRYGSVMDCLGFSFAVVGKELPWVVDFPADDSETESASLVSWKK